MEKLFKKATRVKNAPLIALAFFLAVFIGQKTFASLKVATDTEWLYSPHPTSPDPTDPSQYVMGNVISECPGERASICGILAPDNDGQPEIDTSLESEILAEQKTARVFLKE